MTAYRRTNDIGTTQAAYVAGLIDGEGTVALSRKHARDNRQLCVSISNTELPLLDYVLEIVGAGKITAKRTAHPEHTPSFTYAIHNRQALALLDQIAPHLRTYKRHRAQLILRDYVRLTPRNGKYTDSTRRERLAFERAVQNINPQRLRSVAGGST